MVTRGFLALVLQISKFSGKLLGRTHQMPSVSSSRGRLKVKVSIFINIWLHMCKVHVGKSGSVENVTENVIIIIATENEKNEAK